jgi:hypothetical protein
MQRRVWISTERRLREPAQLDGVAPDCLPAQGEIRPLSRSIGLVDRCIRLIHCHCRA